MAKVYNGIVLTFDKAPRQTTVRRWKNVAAGWYNCLNIFCAYIFKALHEKRMIFKRLWDLDNIQHYKSNLTRVRVIKSCGVHSLTTLSQTRSQ